MGWNGPHIVWWCRSGTLGVPGGSVTVEEPVDDARDGAQDEDDGGGAHHVGTGALF